MRLRKDYVPEKWHIEKLIGTLEDLCINCMKWDEVYNHSTCLICSGYKKGKEDREQHISKRFPPHIKGCPVEHAQMILQNFYEPLDGNKPSNETS